LVDAVLAPESEPAATGTTAEAMGELFVAADLLRHEPSSPAGALGLVDARRAASAAGAPYGMDRAWWEGVLGQAEELSRLLDAEPLDEDAVATVAGRLRDGLRPFV